MNPGLVHKSALESLWITAFAAIGLIVMVGGLAYLMPVMFAEFAGEWLSVTFVRDMVEAVLGAEVGQTIGPAAMAAIPWTHPITLAIVWAHAAVLGTRFPAGEIDRGTADLLMTLPVSRWSIYAHDMAITIAGGLALVLLTAIAALVGMGAAGEALGTMPGVPRVLAAAANLLFLHAAVVGLAGLVAALSDRRGRAVGIIFAILLASFFLNFLAQYWEPAKALRWLGVLAYYRPMLILRGDGTPWDDLLVLFLVGSVLWTAGGVWLSRRSVHVV